MQKILSPYIDFDEDSDNNTEEMLDDPEDDVDNENLILKAKGKDSQHDSESTHHTYYNPIRLNSSIREELSELTEENLNKLVQLSGRNIEEV